MMSDIKPPHEISFDEKHKHKLDWCCQQQLIALWEELGAPTLAFWGQVLYKHETATWSLPQRFPVIMPKCRQSQSFKGTVCQSHAG